MNFKMREKTTKSLFTRHHQYGQRHKIIDIRLTNLKIAEKWQLWYITEFE